MCGAVANPVSEQLVCPDTCFGNLLAIHHPGAVAALRVRESLDRVADACDVRTPPNDAGRAGQTHSCSGPSRDIGGQSMDDLQAHTAHTHTRFLLSHRSWEEEKLGLLAQIEGLQREAVKGGGGAGVGSSFRRSSTHFSNGDDESAEQMREALDEAKEKEVGAGALHPWSSWFDENTGSQRTVL